MQFVFALRYYQLYRKRRANFSFNSDILSAQRDTVRTGLAESVPRREAAIAAVEEALREIESGASPTIDKTPRP